MHMYLSLSFFFFFLAAATCLFSLICALVLAFLDKRAEKILHKEQGETGNVCFELDFVVAFHSLCGPQQNVRPHFVFEVT